ncbi:hypothetical protein [Archaeoglobus neptunius]|uniref:hypothetical protein n=1 Tax=Archaeoglobus neptunius TaxID=2798580 RepID=UPI00192693ED|nr:hypothetical protein [Archaeoglobus neptunius]
MIEEVHDIEEFKSLVREGCRLRYQVLAKPNLFHGVLMGMELELHVYGIAREGHILKFTKCKVLRNKNMKTAEKFQNEDVKAVIEEFEKLAENIGARKGRYYE